MPGTLPYDMRRDAPRLKERGILSRLAFGALCLACCGGIGVVFVSAWQFWMPDSTFQPTVASQHGPNTYISMHGAGAEPLHTRRKAPIQRSVVQRLAMLKRKPGGQGIDMHWAAQLLPHWMDPNAIDDGPRFDVQATLADLVLAVAYLCQAELED